MKGISSCVSLKKACLMVALILGLAMAAGPASAVVFDVKGTKLDLGGYIKLYGGYDINGNVNDSIPNGMGDEVSAVAVPLDGTTHADEDRFFLTARESRVWVKTRTETSIGVLSTVLEGDYNSDTDYSSDTWSNSRQLRLRIAAATLTFGNNALLAGQSWTNFMDFAAAVPTMDLAGDPGQPFVRQPRVRFTHNFDKGHFFAIFVENPDRGFTLAGTPAALFQHTEIDHTESAPDVIASYFWSNDFFHISPKVLLRRFEFDDDSAFAYGLSLTMHVNIGKGNKIYAGLTYGDGIGRYAGLAWTLGCGYGENNEDAYDEGILTGNAVEPFPQLQSIQYLL